MKNNQESELFPALCGFIVPQNQRSRSSVSHTESSIDANPVLFFGFETTEPLLNNFNPLEEMNNENFAV